MNPNLHRGSSFTYQENKHGVSVKAMVACKDYDPIIHIPVEMGINWSRSIFTARRYASAVLAVIVCPSVCPSVRHKSELYKDG